jgi:hypothetical protein
MGAMWREARMVACAMMTISMTAALSACGSSSNDNHAATTGVATPPSGGASGAGASAKGESKAIVVKTHMVEFDGKVLAGSTLGDAVFCAGGTVHHDHGSEEIGFPAVDVFTCGGSTLRIGFGPGPDQMNNQVQTSDWSVLGGTGTFATITGSGQMRVVFPSAGASTGDETFTGTVLIP